VGAKLACECRQQWYGGAARLGLGAGDGDGGVVEADVRPGERERLGDAQGRVEERGGDRTVQEPVMVETLDVTTGDGVGTVDPASVRPRLAEAAAESVEEIRRVLLETATGANRNLWATINCKHCGRAGRYEITVPDNKVRLDAIQALLYESLGRPGQAEAQPAPSLPRTVEQVRALSWDQMNLIFASQVADEIASVADGGDGLLRQRLAALGRDERRILRDALAESEFV
jgi:hypothetical protein